MNHIRLSLSFSFQGVSKTHSNNDLVADVATVPLAERFGIVWIVSEDLSTKTTLVFSNI